MRELARLVGLVTLLTACVGVSTAATVTPTPVFARYSALDVVEIFRQYGIAASNPVPPSASSNLFKGPGNYSSAPLGSGSPFVFTPEPRAARVLAQSYLIVFTNSGDLEATWIYLTRNPERGPFFYTEIYRNANVIMLLLFKGYASPELDPYIVAFSGMK